ncbi:MAG: sulfite exporter TauE/SafE family protein [Bacteroidetes bacterium]|nr:MAG: sulfite exporter TauE/SafE family protein [Bacteroidota bacterium]
MTPQVIIILILIGLVAGITSGFVGVGGGIIIVPALIYMLGLGQHEAQGTSLLLMLPPIGILAVMNYYRAGQINWTYGMIIAATFVLGGYIGSKLSLRMSPGIVRLIFGLIMAYVSVKLIISGYQSVTNE